MLASGRILIYCLLLLTFISGMGRPLAWGASVMSVNKVPGQVESKARRLMHDLKKEGFEVSRGYFKLWGVEGCRYTFDKMGTCYGNNPAAPYVVATLPVWLVGPLCNEQNQNCLGDNWDTAYQLLLPTSLDNDEIYAVAGTLGTETGNATCVGLSINQMPLLKGVMNIPDEDLKGTADGYGEVVGNTDMLFLVYFTRDCSGLKELTDDHCVELPTTMIPEGDSIVLGVRDYIMPGTQRAPDSALILPSRALLLQRPD